MAVQQQETICRYFGTGSLKIFPYTFRLLDTDQLKVFVDGVEKTVGADFTVSNVGQLSGGNITFGIAPANGANVVFTRVSTLERTVDFMDGGVISGEILDYDQDYQTQLIQEIASRSVLIDEQYRVDAKGARITNVGDAINPDDVVTKGYADTILDATQYLASEALASAGQAATSATEAEDFADAADASAAAAAASASAAAISEANAGTAGASAGSVAGAAAAISAVTPYVTQAEDAADAASASATQALAYSNSASISATAASGSASAALSSANAAAASLAAMTPPSRSALITSTGSTIEFTSIPAGVRHLRVVLVGLAVSGATDVVLQLGSGSYETTGYVTYQVNTTAGGVFATSTPTDGWVIGVIGGATAFNGSAKLTFTTGNQWAGESQVISQSHRLTHSGGYKDMPGVIDRVRLSLSSGNFTGSGYILVEWDFWD